MSGSASRSDAPTIAVSDDVNYASNAVDNDQSAYVMMASQLQQTPLLLFSFGKAVGSKLGEFKREDLARTVLNYVVQDLSQITQLVSRCHDIKRVFFTGGFCSTPLVRSIITTEFARRNMTQYIQGQQVTNGFDFVKFGEYLGVLGCVVSDVEHSAEV